MDIKIFFSIVATAIVLIAYLPYFRDIFSSKTKPHAYTWLIWTITQGTAAAGIFYGGGQWGGYYLGILAFVVFAVFLVSLKYGTKNITKSDKIILLLAVAAVIVWWQLKQPMLSVLMVTAIDVLGYIPTTRKSFKDPWSETLIFWGLCIISNIFAILSLREYNLLTAAYLVSTVSANIILFLICSIRRKFVTKN